MTKWKQNLEFYFFKGVKVDINVRFQIIVSHFSKKINSLVSTCQESVCHTRERGKENRLVRDVNRKTQM